MPNEMQIRNDRQDAFDSVRPIIDKINRGERLSGAESRELAHAHNRIQACNIEIAEQRDIRESVYGTGSQDATRSYNSAAVKDNTPESRAFTSWLRSGVRGPELRAAGEGTNSAGGYLVPPGWWQRLQVAIKAYGGTAADFEEIPTDTGQSMLWATTDPTNVVGTLIAENTQISDVDYTFGQGTLSAYMFTSGVQKVSYQLANDSAFNIDQFISARVAEGLGRAEAQYAISGTGSSQPLGVVTALGAATGLTSGGQFTLSTGKKLNVYGPGSGTAAIQQETELTAGAIAPDTVNSLIASVDVMYRTLGAKFYFNDTTLAGMRNVVDGYGQPMYKGLQTSDVKGLTLMDYPVVIDNNIPDLTASAASGIMFGHMRSAMVLRRVQGASVDRIEGSGLLKLEERWADFLQVGYIGYERIDIRSNDLRAVSVTVPAAS